MKKRIPPKSKRTRPAVMFSYVGTAHNGAQAKGNVRIRCPGDVDERFLVRVRQEIINTQGVSDVALTGFFRLEA